MDRESNKVHIPVLISGKKRQKEVVAMIDSGATNTFISKRFVWDNKIPTRKLQNPVLLFNIDGTENRAGRITEMAVLRMKINDHDEQVVFSVTDIDDEDVIIGLYWLKKHNPDMDWEEGLIKLSRCTERCNARTKTVLERPKQKKGKVVSKVEDRDEDPDLYEEWWNEKQGAQALRAGTTFTEKVRLQMEEDRKC